LILSERALAVFYIFLHKKSPHSSHYKGFHNV
jgi:hypothetical protein